MKFYDDDHQFNIVSNGYDTEITVIDEDTFTAAAQEHHQRYNRKFRENYRIPHEHIVVGRVKDLVHPENKMSKSSPEGRLFLDDTPECTTGE